MAADSLLARLAQVPTGDARERDRVCAQVARELHETDVEPPFQLTLADGSDPLLRCAEHYWRLRHLQVPSVRTATACARWLHEHAPEPREGNAHNESRVEIAQRWARRYAVLTREEEESPTAISQAAVDVVDSPSIAYVATVYHGEKLRSNSRFDELHQFLESSSLALAAGPHRSAPLFTALRAAAALGSRRITTEHATDLLNHAWYAPQRTWDTADLCLSALSAAAPFAGQGELLRDWAREAAAEWPENQVVVFRLATGLHLTHEHDQALEAIDLALALLPAVRSPRDLCDLYEEYLARRELILEAGQRAAERAAREPRWADVEGAYRRAASGLKSLTGPLMAVVAVLAVAVFFTVHTADSTPGADLSLGDRMGRILMQGGVLLAFSVILIIASHVALRHRQRNVKDRA